MKWLYDFIFLTFALFSIPKFLIRLNQAEDGRKLICERFGSLSESLKRSCSGRNVVWLHAVSVGEVMAVRQWIKLFLERYPDWCLTLSTSTPTGQSIAKTLASERVSVFYAPFDLSGAVRKTIQAIRPKLIALVETEIWPNLISEAHSLGIPVGIINGRISPRSFKRYVWIRKWLASILGRLSFCLVQSKRDRDFFVQLGMPEAKIVETGNMKFDQADANGRLTGEESFKNKIVRGSLILMAGSTSWNEEEVLLSVFGRLKKDFPGLRLILAPRHPERLGQVVKAVEKSQLQYQLYSQINLQTVPGTAGTGSQNLSRNVPGTGNSEILVIDRMGVLASLYSFADVVFVGGSMVRRGGQNPIEAAASRKAVVHGPNVFNFQDIYQKLDENHAAFSVNSEAELFRCLASLLEQPQLRLEMGERAWNTIQSMKGATVRTLDYLSEWIKPVGARPASPAGGRAMPLQLGERTI